MNLLIRFIVKYFDTTVLFLFLLSGILLIFLDSREYKGNNLTKEFKFSRFLGYTYMIIGITLFIIARYIRV
ncbi:hypothetical protein Q428_00370 [Fervidicella metallireducens AeB]|uniref:Uncharacterized protein n=1 Tax=Fervidicella metallireducens AeB TaxID=1403537 RepID=A0A017RYW4_9CLOT|nr:CLC_0170 family protein [Fervidicella metallireducens]EYE89872.1 hypothetical protein Q428_00370 [Fervidicella metallireducens AeB]